MRSVILVTKLEGDTIRRKCFVTLDKIVAIEVPFNETFKMYFDNAIWNIPSDEYDRIMYSWAPYYNDIKEYRELCNNKYK